jgi:PadR family transcriptional regulator, regulatory protein PadR
MCQDDCRPSCGCRCRGGLLRGFIHPRLLFLLAGHPAHGYELMEALNKAGHLASADAGNLYRVLNHMEKSGLILSTWGMGGSGPARKVYSLTDTGRESLRAWVEELRQARLKLSDFIKEYEEYLTVERKKENEPQT